MRDCPTPHRRQGRGRRELVRRSPAPREPVSRRRYEKGAHRKSTHMHLYCRPVTSIVEVTAQMGAAQLCPPGLSALCVAEGGG